MVLPERAGEALNAMRRHPPGEDAAIIGEVTERAARRVLMKTSGGGVRGVEMLAGARSCRASSEVIAVCTDAKVPPFFRVP